MFKTLVLILTVGIYSHLGGNHVYEYMESRWNCPKESAVENLLRDMNEDGSWKSIDYANNARSVWKPGKHAENLRTLATFYHYHPEREDVLKAIRSSLAWWCARYPKCPNWWWNEIHGPFQFGITGLWMRDYLDKEEMDGILKVMDQLKRWRTGQNKVWAARNWLLKGLLTDDLPLVQQCRDSLISEIVVTTDEGIQPDWSYHQHGHQLQFGNYGLSYAANMTEWIKVFEGTGYDIPKEKQDIIYNYIKEGLRWVVWNGYFDFSACGRQIGPGLQKSKARSAHSSMAKMGIEEAPAGAKYYPYSDFGIYRTDEWYASIRMNSSRTIGYENTNSENMRGYFTADGALLVRRKGDEYNDNCAAWDWRHIPGTTTFNDGKEIYGTPGEKHPYNHSELVFGKVQDEIMVAAMEYDRKGLHARKAWFFFPEGILCLGSGISLDEGLDWDIQTAVNQCRLRGGIESGKNWVSHDGISYVFLDKNKYRIAPAEHSGDWYAIHPSKSKKKVTIDLFDLYTDHGKAPKNASYAYLVFPGGKTGPEAASYAKKYVKVISNSETCQKAVAGGREIVVDWEKGEIRID